MHARRYSLLVLGAVTAVIAAVGAFNLSIDPYLVWRDSGHVGFAGDQLGRLTKAHWIDGYEADLVVLGNSHAAGGFSEASFRRHDLAERPFNGAFPAAQVYEMRRYFQHYAALSDLRAAVVVVDILNFMDYLPAGEAFQEDRLSVAPDGTPNPRWWIDDLVYTNFSGAGLQASVEALVNRRRPTTRTNGFRPCSPAATGTKPDRAVALMGAGYLRFVDRSFLDKASGIDWRQELADLFEDARALDIPLYVVVPPAHATYYMELAASGYWPAYLGMIADIARLAEAAGGDIEVFDFTGFSQVQTELVKAGKPLVYWRDTNHFSCHTGELMLARLAGNRVKVKAFGKKVTAADADARLSAIEAEKRAWMAGSADYCRYVRMMPAGFPAEGPGCE